MVLSRQKLLLILTLALALAGTLTPLSRVLLAGILLLAPGYLLSAMTSRTLHMPRLAGLALIVGLSLSLIPLVFLWATTVGLSLSPLVLWLLLAGNGLLAAWTLRREPARRPPPIWLAGGLLFVFLLALGVRLYEIRDVALPLWVDSVHHALLIRIVSESGRFPTSLQPYMPVDQLVYHWGYHTVAATWQAISGLPTHHLMLLSGQVLNALHVLTTYALAAFLTRSPRAGLFAALATGLLSMMPAYYVTWGRYTQLTGLLILPPLIIVSCALAEARRRVLPLTILTAVTLAGLLLVHYRVLVFYAAFMLAYLLLLACRQPRQLPRAVAQFVAAGLLALALAAPWVWALAREVVIPVAQKPATLLGDPTYNSIDRNLLWISGNRELFAAASIGALIALVRWRWRVLAPALWVGLLLLIANPEAIGGRPLWLINNHSVIITLFLPASILAGFAAERSIRIVQRSAPTRITRLAYGLEMATFVALAAFGGWSLRNIINPVTELTTPADLPALIWADENTPADARFLIGVTPWLNGVYRGTDAGWWLMPFAARWTSTPPGIYGYGTDEYIRAVTQISSAVHTLQPVDEAQVDALIRNNRITHVYIGAKGGPLKVEMFTSRPQYRSVYDQDGVMIFEVQRP